MATQVFFRNVDPTTHRGLNDGTFDAATGAWTPLALATTRGAAMTAIATTTIDGPTNGRVVGEAISGGTGAREWISEPVDQDVTISGSITFNLRALESSMNANVAINAAVYRMAAVDGALTLIHKTVRTTEMGTSEGAANFAETPAAGVALAKGDRILVRVFGDDAGTMAAGFSFSFRFDGPDAGGTGDSFVTFTETFGFLTTAPAGTQLFLTDEASLAKTGYATKQAKTTRGDGVNTAIAWEAPVVYDWGREPPASGGGASVPVWFRADGINQDITAGKESDHLTPRLDDNQTIIAQSFVPDVGGWLFAVGMALSKVGTPTGTFRVQIQSDSAGEPSGALLAEWTGDGTDVFQTNGAEAWYYFDPLVELAASTTYWLCITRDGNDAANYVLSAGTVSPGDSYTSGERAYSTDGGANWTKPANEDVSAAFYYGRPQEWYTPQLEAFTLSGLVRLNLRAQEGGTTCNASLRAEIARVDADGSNPVVWGVCRLPIAELATTETAYTLDVAGDDLGVSAGQRLRIRVFAEDLPGVQMNLATSSATALTLSYDGTSGGATGDSWAQFTQTLTELVAGELVQRRIEPREFVPLHFPNRW